VAADDMESLIVGRDDSRNGANPVWVQDTMIDGQLSGRNTDRMVIETVVHGSTLKRLKQQPLRPCISDRRLCHF
jgi:hypothetical protein